MTVVLEVASTRYDDDILSIKKAMSHMESLLGHYNGYIMGNPSSLFGWTFFHLVLKEDLHAGIARRFSSMISKYSRGNPPDKLAQFMTDYFNSKGCNVKMKVVD